MIVFGLSRSFLLSLLALAVSGFVDMFSMNIRSTMVALATPNHMRGRVNAVEGVFIGASNELGAFESGVAAALIGAVPAVVVGGALTVALAVCWRFVFPSLAEVDRLEDMRRPPCPASPSRRCGRSAGSPGSRPASAPAPADRGERAHEHAARDRHPGPVARAVAKRVPGRGYDASPLDVRVLDGVDVDRLAVGVCRPAFRPCRDGVAAVESGGVVGGGRAGVARAVDGDRAHPADGEARAVEHAEDLPDVARDGAVDDQLAAVRASVEADVRDEEPSELGRPDRAAGVPRRPELRGCHRRDRRVERRQRGHRRPSVLWAAQC